MLCICNGAMHTAGLCKLVSSVLPSISPTPPRPTAARSGIKTPRARHDKPQGKRSQIVRITPATTNWRKHPCVEQIASIQTLLSRRQGAQIGRRTYSAPSSQSYHNCYNINCHHILTTKKTLQLYWEVEEGDKDIIHLSAK